MQENNFERKIQQKLEELKLEPTPKVWEQVSLAVSNRRGGRKWGILFLLLLSVSATGIFLWSNYSSENAMKQTLATEESPQINQLPQPNNPLPASPDEVDQVSFANPATNATTGNPGVIPVRGSKEKAARVALAPSADRLPSQLNKNVQQPAAELVLPQKVVSNTSGINAFAPTSQRLPVENQQKPVKVNDSGDLTTDATNPADLIQATGQRLLTSVPSLITINEPTKSTAFISADTVSNQTSVFAALFTVANALSTKVAPTRKLLSTADKRWKLGVHASMGTAATASGYFGVIGMGSADESKAFDLALNNGSPVVNNPGTGTAFPGNPTYLASPVKRGLGYTLGLSLQKRFTPVVSLEVGLNYKRLATSFSTGSRVDSSGANFYNQQGFFYRAGTSSTYTSHFNFLEIPLVARFKIGQQNKLPLYLHSGLSLATLVNTNALQFDPFTGSYYTNNTLFNKTQVNFIGGLMVSLNGLAKHQLLMGPELNIGLTKMAGSGLYQQRKFSYAGLRLQKTFGR